MNSYEEARGEAWLVYDGECPVCNAWCLRARIRATVGELRLVDARQPGPLMDEITAAGLDIDQGMVLKFRDILYYGPEAIRVMTLLGTRAGWFNRLNYWFFATPGRAGLFYPLGKAVRNLVLKLCGIRYIENLKARRATDAARG